MSNRLAIAAGLLCTLVLGTACGSEDPTGRTSARPTTTTATTELPGQRGTDLPQEAGSVVVTEGGVWMFPHLHASALLVDRTTGELVQEVSLPAYATAAAGGDGMVWARTEGDEQSYTRLDPVTGAVLARVPDVPGDHPVVAYGFLWAVGSDGTLFRIDPDSSDVARFRAQSRGPFFVSPAAGMLWTLGADGLVGIDPASGTATDPWRPIEVLGTRPEQMATAGDTLLFATPTAVVEVDPVARRKVREVAAPAGTRPLAPATQPVSTAAQTTWAFHAYDTPLPDPPRGQTPEPVTVARLDLESGTVVASTQAPFPEFQGIATDGDVIWVGPLRERRIVRFTLD